jgi:hypothetical protein
MRWRILVVWVVLTIPALAFADGAHYTLYGIGTAIGKDQSPGVDVRIEKRLDATRTDEDDEAFVAQGRIGVDVWSAGDHWGFSFPLAWQMGGQAKSIRSTIGGGLGLFAFARDHQEHFGIAPFGSTSLEMTMGKVIISLDGRIARQVVHATDDFNVYSVMLMFGPRYDR